MGGGPAVGAAGGHGQKPAAAGPPAVREGSRAAGRGGRPVPDGGGGRMKQQELDECIEAMRLLWEPGFATYHGKFQSFERVHSDA